MEIILHLTDIHFGFENDNIHLKDSRKLWLDSLVKTLSQLDPSWKPTIVCLTGDLVWRGAASEYSEAKAWLDKVLQACSLSYDDLVMCVGNHEVDRSHAKRLRRSTNSIEADDTFELPISDFLVNQFTGYISFCERNKIPALNFGDKKSYLVGERKIRDLRFLVFNTAWESKEKEDTGKLWLGLPLLKHLDAHEQAPYMMDLYHDPITIALMHHPADWLHEEERESYGSRPSTVQYLTHRCHLLLTGHTHGGKWEHNQIDGAAFHFPGGATYANANYRNCFRLIQIGNGRIHYRLVESDPSSYNYLWSILKPQFLVSVAPKPDESHVSFLIHGITNEHNISKEQDKAQARAAYLQWMIDCHEQLELHGMQYDNGGTLLVPLQQVYLALQADNSNPLERAEARRMLQAQVDLAFERGDLPGISPEQAVWLYIAGSPNMPALESRDRLNTKNANQKQLLNLAEAYYNEASLVILGDPGSGKTTLARWLSLVSAKASASAHLVVPSSQVDPTITDDEQTQSLGLTRLPVLIRIADYAEARNTAIGKREIPPTLGQFLGWHKWQGQTPKWPLGHPKSGSPVDPLLLNELIHDTLKEGKALIILDGLDEIPASSQRDDIVEEVDRFAKLWVRNQQITTAFFDENSTEIKVLWSRFTADKPGNRIVITSRIAGYHQAPLHGDIAHVTVEPMSILAVEKFISHWMRAVYRGLSGLNQATENTADREAQRLLTLLKDPRYLGAQELATNPLLCSLLATTFRHGNGTLPRRRVELYKQVIDKLIDIWIRRERDAKALQPRIHEMFAVLEPIAEYTHRNIPTGLLQESKLETLALHYLAEARQENPQNPSLATRASVTNLIQIVRENVGLLAARGEKVYGFLHLTFQEYLAACCLLRDRRCAASRIAEHLSDARWREVIRLALGEIGRRDPDDLLALATALLDQQSDLQDLLPQAALTIVAALPDIDPVPAGLVESLVKYLIQTYTQSRLLQLLPSRRELLLSAMKTLLTDEFEESVEDCLSHSLNQANKNPETAAAVAELVYRLGYYTPKISSALQRAISYDQEAWHWPIHTALRIGMTPHGSDSILRLSPALGSLPFRQALLTNPQLVESIQSNIDWLKLIIALYGGVGDFEAADSIKHYHMHAHFLQLEDQARNRHAIVLKERWGEGDFVYNIAVHLDTVGKELKNAWEKPLKFCPEWIYRDSAWTPDILKALRNKSTPNALLQVLRNTRGDKAEEAGFIAWVLEGSLTCYTNPAIQSQVEYLESALCDATVRCSSLLAKECVDLIGTLPPTQGWALYEAALNLVLFYGGLPLGSPKLLPVHRPYLLAELLVQFARGCGEDVVYNAAVFADTIQCEPQELIAAFCLTPIAAHHHWQSNMYDWPMVMLPPASSRSGDIPSAILTSIELLPASLGFLRVWSLGQRLRPLVMENPDLLPDVLAACLGDVGERSGRVDLLEAYKPELLNSLSPAEEVLALTRAVKNPYYRARALCRLARHMPTQRDSLLDEAETATNAISDSFEKTQVLELLVANRIGGMRLRSWQRCYKAVLCLSDADEKARALARLGVLASDTEAKTCFEQALNSALQINDEFTRGTTLRILSSILQGHEDLFQAMRDAAKNFKDPLMGARAIADWGGVLRHSQGYWNKSATTPELWAVLSLMGQCGGSDIVLKRGVDQLWQKLSDIPSQNTVQRLLDSADKGRFDCTLAACQCLGRLLKEDHEKLAVMLMPKLQANAAEAIPFLEEHARCLGNPIIASSAALLLAEMRGLYEWIIPGFVEALKSTNELTRLRAMELLYIGSNKEASHRASVIGKSGLYDLFEVTCEADFGQVHVGNAVTWFNERLMYDSAGQIEAWTENLNNDPDNSAAKFALSHIIHFEPQVFRQAMKELAYGQAPVKTAILISMAHLARWDRLAGEDWETLNRVVESLDLKNLEKPKYMIFKLEDLCAVVLEALQSATDTGNQVKLARQLLVERYGISFADIFRLPIDERLPKLKSLGQMMYAEKTNESARWAYNATTARSAVAEAGFIELLCAWLLEVLKDNLNDPYNPYYERSFLLDLLAGAAITAPASFVRCELSAQLEPYLIAVLQAHRSYTGRADAILLLGYHRNLSLEVLPALRSALTDVEQVREAAMEAVLMFRNIHYDVLQELFEYLYADSSLLALAAARLLTTLGRHDKAGDERRKQIVEALAEATRDPRSNRPIHFDAGLTPTPDMPMLNNHFYDALLKVSGYEMNRRVGNQ